MTQRAIARPCRSRTACSPSRRLAQPAIKLPETADLDRLRRRLRRLQPGGRDRQRAQEQARASTCACCRARTTSRARSRCARARCRSRPTASAAPTSRRKASTSSAPRNGARSRCASLLLNNSDALLTIVTAKDANIHTLDGPEGQARRLGGRRAVAQPEHHGDARLRQPDLERREEGRVPRLRPGDGGHHRQPGRRRLRLDASRATPTRSRPRRAASATRSSRTPTRRAGRGCNKIAPVLRCRHGRGGRRASRRRSRSRPRPILTRC